MSTRSEFVDFIRPMLDRYNLYNPSKPSTDQPKNDAADPAKAIPRGFIDAMIVREEVFVKEQGVPLENESDEDDRRSFHWVAYASIPVKSSGSTPDSEGRKTSSTKIPIGTIRLVPPPHAPHPTPSGSSHGSNVHKETYVKLGRLAVIKEFRKAGISKLLIETALAYIREHPYDLDPRLDPASIEASKKGAANNFKGLVLIHSQVGVQKVWKKYGFETDESMGVWDEEGIDHVGMWKKMDVSESRKKSSKAWLGSSHTTS